MARGWESKSVEDQVAAAEAAKETHAQARFSAAERKKETERQSLRLSRTQIMNRLNASTNPQYRRQLESALRHLEDRLREIDSND